jgi:iron(II)-dependent oxidoreductase
MPDATRADLAAQLDSTLALLAQADGTTTALYFFRLALVHEDMHHEAGAVHGACPGHCGGRCTLAGTALPEPPAPLAFAPGPWTLGSAADDGFAFDNELAAHTVALDATEIDRVLRWADYLPFVRPAAMPMPRLVDRGRQWRWRQAAAPARPLPAPRRTAPGCSTATAAGSRWTRPSRPAT